MWNIGSTPDRDRQAYLGPADRLVAHVHYRNRQHHLRHPLLYDNGVDMAALSPASKVEKASNLQAIHDQS
jgi:hypothetical protein